MGSEAVGVRNVVRFGRDFELNLETHMLYRAGRALKLERIPLEVLLLLVMQAGRVVTREQIVEKVWGKGRFLDSDNSINGAIRKIRQVLRDTPEQPRYIQTITGTGYRFVASVIDDAELSAPEAHTRPAMPAVVPAVEAQAMTRRPSRWLTIIAAMF